MVGRADLFSIWGMSLAWSRQPNFSHNTLIDHMESIGKPLNLNRIATSLEACWASRTWDQLGRMADGAVAGRGERTIVDAVFFAIAKCGTI